jgi:hypothetical protein
MASAPKKRSPKKHPKDMTTEEAIRHVFHPKIVKHLKKHVENLNREPTKEQ